MQFQLFDADYLERLRAGDYRTQENFCVYFTSLIHIKLRSRLRSRSAIDDVRQEIFARFFANLRSGSIHEPERLGAYMNSMCNNVLRELFRADSRQDPLEEGDAEDVPDPAISPLDVIASKQTEEKVREILDKLPERDRRLLREVLLEERDKDEVCRNYGIDREYLRVLLHRAKKAFKALYLKDMGDDPPELSPA